MRAVNVDKILYTSFSSSILNKFNSSSFREQQNTIKTLINEAGNLLLASPELRKALISNKGSKFYKNDEISTYCQFINKYINTINEINKKCNYKRYWKRIEYHR